MTRTVDRATAVSPTRRLPAVLQRPIVAEIIKLPECGRTYARHAFQKVTPENPARSEVA